MQNDPNYPIRKYIRLRGYDYSNTGFYFITKNVQNRLCLFGNIVNGKMILNDAGRMVEKWYYELENKFPNTRCHEMVVMPDHFHCIIENVMVAHVGAPLRGRPLPNHQRPLPNNEHKHPKTNYGINNKKTNATIGDAVRWFKTMTTNEYIQGVKQNGWQRFDRILWQRNFFDHIIRNEESYIEKTEYIKNNPQNWP